MKRFILILTCLLLAVSLCSCKDNGETVAEPGTELAGRGAGNEAVYYTFTYPEEWELARDDGVIEIQYDCDESEMTAKYATISVLSFGLSDTEQGAKAYWESHEKELQSLYTDYKFLDTEEYNEEGKLLDDSPALKVKYSGKINEISYMNEQIICCRYGSVYLITLVVPEEHYDKVSGSLNAIKENFDFE